MYVITAIDGGDHGIRGAMIVRQTARTTTSTNHKAITHNAAFAAAANAIPVGEDGAERNGPPRTSHQTVTPGCTKSERGFLTAEGMTPAIASSARAAALMIANT